MCPPKEPEILPAIKARRATPERVRLWDYLGAFLSSRAQTTQTTYRGILAEWCRFLGAEIPSSEAQNLFLAATDLHAARYRRWLEGRRGESPRLQQSPTSHESGVIIHRPGRAHAARDGLQTTLGNATIRKKLIALRRLYRAAIAADLGVTKNPFDPDKIPLPPLKSGTKRPTEMVDYELVEAMLRLPDTSMRRGRRDRAILATLFGGGLRRGELIKLRIGDVKKTRKGTSFLFLRATKGKRDADQAVPPWAAEAIAAVVRDRRDQGARDGDYLFVSFRGRAAARETNAPLSPVGLYRLFRSYAVRAGVAYHVSPHSARATAITRLLDRGLSHREVREFSRHASIQMVEVYDKRRTDVDTNPGGKLSFS